MISRFQRGGWVYLLIATAVFFIACFPVNDFDSWIHLSFGRHMVETLGPVTQEVFVYPNLDSGLTNPYWFFQIPLYLSFKAAGLTGIILFRAAVVVLLFISFAVLLRQMGVRSDFAIFCYTLITALLMRFRFAERPEIFAYLFFVIFLLLFTRAHVSGETKLLFLLPPVQLFWANSHQSASLGLLIASLFSGGMIIEQFLLKREPASGKNIPPSHLGFVLLLTALGYLVNPNTFTQALAPVSLATSRDITESIQELQPVTSDPVYLGAYAVVFITGLIAVLRSRRTIPLAWIALFLIFAYISFRVVRSLPLFFLTAMPAIALAFPFSREGNSGWRLSSTLVPVALAATILVTGISGSFSFGFGEEKGLLPSGGISFLKDRGLEGRRIFHPFGWGGYVSWRMGEGRAFIDGRFVTGPLSEDYDHMIAASSRLGSLLEKYGIEVILTNAIGITDGIVYPLMDYLLFDSSWKPVYADGSSLVFVKRDAMPALPEIERTTINTAMIEEARYLRRIGVRGRIDKTLGELYLRAEDYKEARKFYEAWLKENPDDVNARQVNDLLQGKGY